MHHKPQQLPLLSPGAVIVYDTTKRNQGQWDKSSLVTNGLLLASTRTPRKVHDTTKRSEGGDQRSDHAVVTTGCSTRLHANTTQGARHDQARAGGTWEKHRSYYGAFNPSPRQHQRRCTAAAARLPNPWTVETTLCFKTCPVELWQVVLRLVSRLRALVEAVLASGELTCWRHHLLLVNRLQAALTTQFISVFA